MNLLNFVGIGSAFAPNLGNTSAYFIKDRTFYLIDCGGLVFKELYNLIDFDTIEEVNIFITHTHNDHVGSLGTLISYLKNNYGRKSNIFHGGINIEAYLNLSGISENYYTASNVKLIEKEDFTFRFIETNHSNKIPSFGILIEREEESIYYSGDSVKIPTKILDAFIDRKIAFIYQDITIKMESSSDLTLKEAEKIIPESLRNKVIVMHLDHGAKELIQGKGFQLARRIQKDIIH